MSVKTYTELQSCLKRVFSYLLIPSILSNLENPQLKVNKNLMSYHRSIDGNNDFSTFFFLFFFIIQILFRYTCVLLYMWNYLNPDSN